MSDKPERKWRKTRVRQLEGRTVEKAVICHGDLIDDHPNGISGPYLELLMSGGFTFVFTAIAPRARPIAEALIHRNDPDVTILAERIFPDEAGE